MRRAAEVARTVAPLAAPRRPRPAAARLAARGVAVQASPRDWRARAHAGEVPVSPAEVDEFRRQGFLVLRGFYGPKDLEEWRAAVEEAVAERGKDWIFPQKGQDDATNVELDYFHNVFTQRLQLWSTNAKVKRLFQRYGSLIGRIGAELEGVDGLRIWHDQALIKEAYANPTGFHVDNPFWSFSTKHAISVWMALDDATKENGCLHFIPGSHSLIGAKPNPYKEIKIGKDMKDLFAPENHPELLELKPVAVEMSAGDISFHNGLTAHGAGPNLSNLRRRAMTCAMMPVGSVHNGTKNVLSEEQFARYKVGDAFESDAEFPLLWESGQDPASLPRFPAGLPNKMASSA